MDRMKSETKLKLLLKKYPGKWATVINNRLITCKRKVDFSPLQLLTELQKERIIIALENGYFDYENRKRKISQIELAEIIGISPSVLCIQLNRSVSVLLKSLLEK